MQKRLGTVQNFTLTQTSQASAKFGAQTYRVRIAASSTASPAAGAWILFGDSTALTVSSTNGSLFPSDTAEEFDVVPGQTFYTVAVSTAQLGPISLTELT
jgi:hypothetical protein